MIFLFVKIFYLFKLAENALVVVLFRFDWMARIFNGKVLKQSDLDLDKLYASTVQLFKIRKENAL